MVGYISLRNRESFALLSQLPESAVKKMFIALIFDNNQQAALTFDATEDIPILSGAREVEGRPGGELCGHASGSCACAVQL